MVVMPAATPVTTPVDGFTVAMPGEVLDHVPPGVASFKVIVLPAHTAEGPEIGCSGFTVTEVVTRQPVGIV